MTRPRDILIVDDSPEDRETYRRLLSRASDQFAIREAETAADCLNACQDQLPDCMLLDYNLPDENGLELLAQLIDPQAPPPTAVVMLTGQGNEAIAVEAMKQGAQDYLIKSNMTALELERAIHNAIQKVSLLRAVDQQRQELARSNQELEQFAYAACHDLQAPLRRTQGFCELLRRRYEGQLDENADSYLEAIGASVRHMQTLITDLLNFSRAGTKQLNLEMVSFQEVAQRAMDNLQAAIGEADGQVHVDPLPTLPADRTQMVQLLQNLIGNALTYHGSAPPLVHVSAEQGEKEVCFRVQDNGIGIAEEYVDEIFKIFKRLHSDSEYPGTGIGLATCQKIVQRHGGRIWVDSQPGKGSTFSFTLPLTPDMTGGDEG